VSRAWIGTHFRKVGPELILESWLMCAGVIAISCNKRITLDERIDMGPPIYPKSSLLVIWSFHDPINPQVNSHT
jgi:hypothetical protein